MNNRPYKTTKFNDYARAVIIFYLTIQFIAAFPTTKQAKCKSDARTANLTLKSKYIAT